MRPCSANTSMEAHFTGCFLHYTAHFIVCISQKNQFLRLIIQVISTFKRLKNGGFFKKMTAWRSG
jgi:hypothetical protein